jgi:hypothetical protein
MAKLVQQAKSKCPDTKIALGGYSQGGFVVSNAIAKSGLNPDDIVAAVLYGDPSRNAAGGLDKSKVKDYCASGDGVCAGTFAISAAHLSYTRYVMPVEVRNYKASITDFRLFCSNGDTTEGAAFIVSQSQGGSGTASSGTGSTTGSTTTGGTTASGTTGSAASTTSKSSLSSWTDLFSGGSSLFGGN